MDEATVDLHPVMRRRDLRDEVVVRVDAEVIGLEAEDARPVALRDALQLRHDHIDDEATAGREMRSCVLEHRDLFLLRRDVHERVPHEIDERELTGDAGRRHVADRHRDRVGTGLGAQLLDHVRGELDAVHLDAARDERERDASGADGELEHGTAGREVGEELDGRTEDPRIEHRHRGDVVDLGDVATPT